MTHHFVVTALLHCLHTHLKNLLKSRAKAPLDRQNDKISTGKKHPDPVFIIPCHDASNKALERWMKASGIKKHITWSCARLNFSVLLQDKNVDNATVA